MSDRRDFLKTAAKAAALIGAQSFARSSGIAAQGNDRGMAKVVLAKGAVLRSAGSQPDERSVLALLDRALTSYFARKDAMEAWKLIGFPSIVKNKVVGIKVSCAGGKGIATHPVLVHAICQRLQQAGVTPGNIIVWDRSSRDLEACGFTINRTDRSKVRCLGADAAGFETQPRSWGVVHSRLSKIVTQECAIIINVPILADDATVGMAFALKNLDGALDRADMVNANRGKPGIADLNCIEEIREKVCMTIGDAISSIYDGGPGFNAAHLWSPGALIVGEDRVAVDCIALELLNRKRVASGLPTLEAAGRAPDYIKTAGDTRHNLGESDRRMIKRIDV